MHSFFNKNQEILPEPQCSYFSYISQPQNVLILFLFYHLFFLPILILHLTMYLNVWSFSKKIQSLATKPLPRLFSSQSFVLNVYHRTKFSCISGHLFKNTLHGLFWTPIHESSSFELIINCKSNLLSKTCIEVTFHVVFVRFCHDIVNVKHCVRQRRDF